MKQIVIALALVLCCTSGVWADVHTLSDCEYTTVNDFINNATPAGFAEGDTVVCPADSVTWESPLVITVPMTFTGAGSDKTVISSAISSRGTVEYKRSAATDGPFTMSGFGITNTSGYPLLISAPMSSADIVRNVRVHHSGLTGAIIGVYIMGNVYGVIDNNTIVGRCSNESGAGYTAFDALNSSASYGSVDNLYWEDNNVTIPITANTAFPSGHGSVYVARYNTIIQLSTGATTAFDAHGNMAGNPTNMIAEAYGNSIASSASSPRLATMMGGRNIIFYNYTADTTSPISTMEEYDDQIYKYGSVTGSGSDFVFSSGIMPSDTVGIMNIKIIAGTGIGQDYAITTRNSDAATGSIAPNTWSPALDATSFGVVYYSSGDKSTRLMHVNDSYFWNNRKSNGNLVAVTNTNDNYWTTGTGTPATVVHNPPVIYENAQYWQQTAAEFDGSTDVSESCGYYGGSACTKSGVGCGTIALRPATCTTGVGYWATDQSCSDLTGMIGANPTTPISGTLYKCTSTNTWASYYTPYTYPHPLRGQERRMVIGTGGAIGLGSGGSMTIGN